MLKSEISRVIVNIWNNRKSFYLQKVAQETSEEEEALSVFEEVQEIHPQMLLLNQDNTIQQEIDAYLADLNTKHGKVIQKDRNDERYNGQALKEGWFSPFLSFHTATSSVCHPKPHIASIYLNLRTKKT